MKDKKIMGTSYLFQLYNDDISTKLWQNYIDGLQQ